MRHPLPHAQSVSRLHPVERDLAIVVKEEVTHDALMECIKKADTTHLLKNATLFDVYRPAKPDVSVQSGEKAWLSVCSCKAQMKIHSQTHKLMRLFNQSSTH